MKGPLQNQCLVCPFWATVEKHGSTIWWTGRGPASLADIKRLILNNKKHNDSSCQGIIHQWKHNSEYYIPLLPIDPPKPDPVGLQIKDYRSG